MSILRVPPAPAVLAQTPSTQQATKTHLIGLNDNASMTEARTSIREVIRLTALLLAVALATSRLGLLAHELVGHGGTTLLVGGRVTDVQLFWFAGGWIRYQFAGTPTTHALLLIAMG